MVSSMVTLLPPAKCKTIEVSSGIPLRRFPSGKRLGKLTLNDLYPIILAYVRK